MDSFIFSFHTDRNEFKGNLVVKKVLREFNTHFYFSINLYK